MRTGVCTVFQIEGFIVNALESAHSRLWRCWLQPRWPWRWHPCRGGHAEGLSAPVEAMTRLCEDDALHSAGVTGAALTATAFARPR